MRGPRRQAAVTQWPAVCALRVQASNHVFQVSHSQEQDTTAWSDHEDMAESHMGLRTRVLVPGTHRKAG